MTTPHPLAKEAANQVIQFYVENATREEGEHIETIIHTTALQPVIEAGDRLLIHLRHEPLCATVGGYEHGCTCGLDASLATWRGLTSPKTGQTANGVASPVVLDPISKVETAKTP